MSRNFMEMLQRRWEEGDTVVCVGLDSDYSQIPEAAQRDSIEDTTLAFNCAIVDATCDLVCAYKLNIAFYEAQGPCGLRALIQTMRFIREQVPAIPVILDAKWGDIGNTNGQYVRAAFEMYRADALTVNPYFGHKALQPFLDETDRGIIVLCRTSNPGAGEFQDPHLFLTEEECQNLFYNEATGECTRDIPNDPITMPFYQYVAYRVANHWNKNGNCALVVGAPYPEELAEVRQIVGDMPLLVPGIGSQGGEVEKTVKAGLDSNGEGMIINVSRAVIFASPAEDFAEAARQKALAFRDEINKYR